MSKDAIGARLTRLEEQLGLLVNVLTKGAQTTPTTAQKTTQKTARKRTPKETNTATPGYLAVSAVDGMPQSEYPSDTATAMHLPQGKRQKKLRNMSARARYYVLKKMTLSEKVVALEGLPRTTVDIYDFIEAHPGVRIPEIAAGVDDCKPRTAKNAVWRLGKAQRNLIKSVM